MAGVATCSKDLVVAFHVAHCWSHGSALVKGVGSAKLRTYWALTQTRRSTNGAQRETMAGRERHCDSSRVQVKRTDQSPAGACVWLHSSQAGPVANNGRRVSESVNSNR